MTNRFQIPISVILALLLVVSACDDPSPIGLELVGAESGETNVVTLGTSYAAVDGTADITLGTSTEGAFRSLFGQVADPAAGMFTMSGFVDFIPSSNVTAAFRAGNVSFADLALNIDYVYGDSTQSVTISIYDINADWPLVGARSDTTLAASVLVTTASLEATKGMVYIPLPSNWISRNNSILKSTTFSDLFNGFAIRATQGDAILGAHFSGSSMRASSVPGDTVNFSMSKVFSAYSGSPSSSNGNVHIVRDGASNSLSMRFPIKNDELGQVAVHRVIFRLNSEDLSSMYPAGFVRPGVTRIGLRAVALDNKTRLNVSTADVLEDGTLTFDASALANIVQSANLADSELDRFELYFPNESSSVDFLAFKKGLPATFGPRAVITYTPIK